MNTPSALARATLEDLARSRNHRTAVSKIDALADACLERLRYATAGLDALGIIDAALHGTLSGHGAVLSSFGAESAVLLHLVSQVDPHAPILFVDTGRMFPETLAYRDLLQERLGLTDVRTIGPPAGCDVQPETNEQRDSVEACCRIRKVFPLARALEPFGSIITGRKRFQTKSRMTMETVELFEGRFRFNPLAEWSSGDLEAYVERYGLPHHPLVERGYPSIGCREPCTRPVGCRAYSRAGRWPAQNKEECGIHGT